PTSALSTLSLHDALPISVVRPVLDFDRMIARLIGPSGAFQGRDLRVSDEPEELPPGDKPEDYSFFSQILAREPVLVREARAELEDPKSTRLNSSHDQISY